VACPLGNYTFTHDLAAISNVYCYFDNDICVIQQVVLQHQQVKVCVCHANPATLLIPLVYLFVFSARLVCYCTISYHIINHCWRLSQIGSYGPNSTLTSCKTCDHGTYTFISGSVSCRDCPQGRYSDVEGLTECLEWSSSLQWPSIHPFIPPDTCLATLIITNDVLMSC
jgi:hypothetical protein